jgi:hypothetical protein
LWNSYDEAGHFLEDFMSAGFDGAAIGAMMFFAWLLPLAGVIIVLVLGIRFVRAAERLANAAETLARNASLRVL